MGNIGSLLSIYDDDDEFESYGEVHGKGYTVHDRFRDENASQPLRKQEGSVQSRVVEQKRAMSPHTLRAPRLFPQGSLFHGAEWKIAAVRYFRDTLGKHARSPIWRTACHPSKPRCNRLMIGKFQAAGPLSNKINKAQQKHTQRLPSITAMAYTEEVLQIMAGESSRGEEGQRWAHKNFIRLLRVYVHLGTEHRSLLKLTADSTETTDKGDVTASAIAQGYWDFLRFGLSYGMLETGRYSPEIVALSSDVDALLLNPGSDKPELGSSSLPTAVVSPSKSFPYFLNKIAHDIRNVKDLVERTDPKLPADWPREADGSTAIPFKWTGLKYFLGRLKQLGTEEMDAWCSRKPSSCDPMLIDGQATSISGKTTNRAGFLAGLEASMKSDYELEKDNPTWLARFYRRLLRVFIHTFTYHTEEVLQSRKIWPEFRDFVLFGGTYGLLDPSGEAVLVASYVSLVLYHLPAFEYDDHYFLGLFQPVQIHAATE
eukprot:g36509.t1